MGLGRHSIWKSWALSRSAGRPDRGLGRDEAAARGDASPGRWWMTQARWRGDSAERLPLLAEACGCAGPPPAKLLPALAVPAHRLVAHLRSTSTHRRIRCRLGLAALPSCWSTSHCWRSLAPATRRRRPPRFGPHVVMALLRSSAWGAPRDRSRTGLVQALSAPLFAATWPRAECAAAGALNHERRRAVATSINGPSVAVRVVVDCAAPACWPVGDAGSVSCPKAAANQICDANRHAARRFDGALVAEGRPRHSAMRTQTHDLPEPSLASL